MGIRPKRAPLLDVVIGFIALAMALVGGPMANLTLQGVGAEIPAQTAYGHATAPEVTGSYVPTSPVRITDTRPGSGYPNAGSTLGPAASLNVEVAGVGGVPVSGISAVVLNITVVNPTVSSFLTVFPEGTIQPAVSNLNFTAAETLANLVTVAVGSQGGITIYNHAGNANVLVDVEGYYTTTPLTTGLYNPVSAVRVLGSSASGITVGPGTLTPVKVAGVDGVPVDASAVVANVTVAGATTASYLTVFPAPKLGLPSPPTASNVNFSGGQVLANRVILPVGNSGQIDIYNYTGSVKVDVDLNGYYTGSSRELGSAFTPLSPDRFVDTRVGRNGTPVSPNSSEDFSFASEGISVTAIALASNMTVVAGGTAGYIGVYPATDASPPAVSDANLLGQCGCPELYGDSFKSGKRRGFQQQRPPHQHRHRCVWLLRSASRCNPCGGRPDQPSG